MKHSLTIKGAPSSKYTGQLLPGLYNYLLYGHLVSWKVGILIRTRTDELWSFYWKERRWELIKIEYFPFSIICINFSDFKWRIKYWKEKVFSLKKNIFVSPPAATTALGGLERRGEERTVDGVFMIYCVCGSGLEVFKSPSYAVLLFSFISELIL